MYCGCVLFIFLIELVANQVRVVIMSFILSFRDGGQVFQWVLIITFIGFAKVHLTDKGMGGVVSTSVNPHV